MVKKMISQLSALIVLIVFTVACSKSMEYTNAIPLDAMFVATFDFKSLADKAGLNDKANEEMKNKLMETLKSGTSATTYQQLEKWMKNPSALGVDFQSPIYVFTSPFINQPTIVVKVSNASNLRETLDVMTKENITQPVSEADGFQFTTSDDAVIGFNESAAIIMQVYGTTNREEAKKTIGELLKQSPNNSINANHGFQKSQKEKGDINFFINMNTLPDVLASQINATLPADINTKELTLLANLTFEKGKVATRIEYYTENKEVKAILEKQEKALTKLNNTFLKNFPESTVAFFNVGTNGQALYDLLLDNNDFRNTVSIAKAVEVKELFNSFKGDVSVGLVNIDMNNTPSFMAYAEVSNAKSLKAVYDNKQAIGLSRGEDIVQLKENEYVYKSRDINLFFGVVGKQMYATNDETLYKNINKPVDKSIKDTDYASEMKGKQMYAVINMNAILELPIVKMMVGFGGEEFAMYYSLASKISYLEASSEGNGKGEMNLYLKDKDTNALKQIVDFVKQFAGM